MTSSGIYRIVNITTDTTYIGSSLNVQSRLLGHAHSLQRGKHRNPHLQASWNKYGERTFTFEALLSLKESELRQREQDFLNAYRDHEMKLYNCVPSDRSRPGFQICNETRSKMSEALIGNKRNLGFKHTLETRAKMSAASKGRRKSLEARINMGLARRGTHPSLDARRKMSAAAKARSPEIRAKASKAQIGKSLSVETRRKISLALKGKAKPWLVGRVFTPEHRAKLSAAGIRRYSVKNKEKL